MNIQRFQQGCTNYLSGFDELKNFKDNDGKKNAIASLKIISYFATVFIAPAIAWALKGLAGRFTNVTTPNPQQQRTKDAVSKTLNVKPIQSVTSEDVKTQGSSFELKLQKPSRQDLLDLNKFCKEIGVHLEMKFYKIHEKSTNKDAPEISPEQFKVFDFGKENESLEDFLSSEALPDFLIIPFIKPENLSIKEKLKLETMGFECPDNGQSVFAANPPASLINIKVEVKEKAGAISVTFDDVAEEVTIKMNNQKDRSSRHGSGSDTPVSASPKPKYHDEV